MNIADGEHGEIIALFGMIDEYTHRLVHLLYLLLSRLGAESSGGFQRPTLSENFFFRVFSLRQAVGVKEQRIT